MPKLYLLHFECFYGLVSILCTYLISGAVTNISGEQHVWLVFASVFPVRITTPDVVRW